MAMFCIQKNRKDLLLNAYKYLRGIYELNEIVDFSSFDDFLFFPFELKDNFRFFDDLNEDAFLNRIKRYSNETKQEFHFKNEDLINENALFLSTYLIDRFYNLIEINDKNTISIDECDRLDSYLANKDLVWRGQYDVSLDLVPSMLRNFKNGFIQNQDIYRKYERSGLDRKYEELFSKCALGLHTDSVVEFMAYMQHAEAKSPFLDFSHKPEIGIIFANYQSYEHDVALYSLDLKKNSFDLSKFKNNEFPLFEITKINKITPMTRLKERFLWNLNETEITSHFEYWDEPLNDRMKYQSGLFLFPNNGVIINNHLILNYQEIGIHKFIIKNSVKKEIVKSIIDNHPQYKYENLMNPYAYFKVN